MKLSILSVEEERINSIAFGFGVLSAIGAFIVVVGFLEGSPRDSIVLTVLIVGLLIRFFEKNVQGFKKYAKYAYMAMPFCATYVIVISNDGKFAAVTQFYFMWLMLSIAYYDVKVVLFCSGVTIISTAGAMIFFPDAMMQLDNLTIWFYIFTIYLMATILAAVIANRMRNLFEQAEQAKMYEMESIYLEQLEKKEEKHSEFIHNINHYFVAIGELAREEHCEQIMNLMQELKLNLTQNERIIYTNHKVVNAVLSDKVREAQENQIGFDIYVEPGIQFGEVTNGDLVVMLGNLLDNALGAAKLCEKEKRRIILRIFKEKDGRVCVVKLVNYFVKKPVRHKTGFISTKREKGRHGIGIKSVENVIKKYEGYLQCLVEEECFSAILIIPLRK